MAALQLIKYILLQITIGPSIICDLIVFIYFIIHWRKAIIRAPQNHVILCLLIASFIQKSTDIIFHLYFLRWTVVLVETYNFCVLWNWLNYSLYCINLHLTTWCCIERHLFVFHSQIMKNKQYLILFHYIPLIICLLYTPMFYLRFIVFPSACTNDWDYHVVYCGGACFSFYDQFWGMFDWLFHYGTPVFIIIFANFILFCRVIWQKFQQQRAINWKRQRQTIIQLLLISCLFLVFGFPSVIVGCIQLLWMPTFASDVQNNYFFFAGCFINQFLPFVIISSLPKIVMKLKAFIRQCKRHCCHSLQIYPALTRTVVREQTFPHNYTN